jgi:hypothetical protein
MFGLKRLGKKPGFGKASKKILLAAPFVDST